MKRFRKYVWPLRSWIVAIALILAVGGAIDNSLQTHETAVEARKAAAASARTSRQLRDSVCALVAERHASIKELRDSLKRAQDFLQAHPEGVNGITRVDIQAGIDSTRAQIAAQRGTVRAFHKIRCP